MPQSSTAAQPVRSSVKHRSRTRPHTGRSASCHVSPPSSVRNTSARVSPKVAPPPAHPCVPSTNARQRRSSVVTPDGRQLTPASVLVSSVPALPARTTVCSVGAATASRSSAVGAGSVVHVDAAVAAGGDRAVVSDRPAARPGAGDPVQVRTVRDGLQDPGGAGGVRAQQCPAGAGHPDLAAGDQRVGPGRARAVAERTPGPAAVGAPAQPAAGAAGEHEPAVGRRQGSARPGHREAGRRPAPPAVAAAHDVVLPRRPDTPGGEQPHGAQRVLGPRAAQPPGPAAVGARHDHAALARGGGAPVLEHRHREERRRAVRPPALPAPAAVPREEQRRRGRR